MDCLVLRGAGAEPLGVGLKMEDACREYQSSLEDLTFNSKPHINMLTILAEENLHLAKDIVAIIEAQISQAPSSEKLPVLYLVDSIVKNVGGEYLAVFAKNLVTSFICVFEKVDENTRKSLFKLRSTWDEVFPLKKLYALDVRVNSLDPAWPIKPLPPNVNASIHVNPKFLKQPEETASRAVAPQAPPPQPGLGVLEAGLTQEQLIRQQLLAKQKQLLELQQKKIELELEQTRAQLTGSFMVVPPSAPTPARPPPSAQPDAKPPPRDPRLNRTGPQQPPIPPTPEKRAAEKVVRTDKPRPPKRDALPDKAPSPLPKSMLGKKVPDGPKKDPRLKKRPQDRAGLAEDEPKDRKRPDKREDAPHRPPKSKLLNGSSERPEPRAGGNARTNARKRTHSRSPSGSPKRRERRSPKGRARSGSPSPPHKLGKARRMHGDDRGPPKKSQADGKRPRRSEERHPEPRDIPRDPKEALHRWRSGWEESKRLKPADGPHVSAGPQRHKPYSAPSRPPTPRTPKHRLSVDANIHIPDILNSASKKDLLRKAHQRREAGELSQEEFLNVAHQIRQLFQYRQEKLQRSESSDQPVAQQLFPPGNKKKPLLATPPSSQPRPELVDAQLSYYEHKSKLRRTQVSRRPPGGEQGDSSDEAECPGATRRDPSLLQYSRPPARERIGEQGSEERDEPPQQTPMIEEYNHGKEFPPLTSLPGLRFRRRQDPRETSEREWNSPLTERQRYEEREEPKSGYDAPRRYAAPPDPRRQDRPIPPAPPAPPPAPGGEAGPGYERERLSPLRELSPAPRFESPNSEHSEEDAPPPPRPILKAPPRPPPVSPGNTPPHDGHASSRYEGPPRPHPPGRYQGPGCYDDVPRYDGPRRPPHGPPERFIGPYDGPPRFQGPSGPMPFQGQSGPLRFDPGMGPGMSPGGPGMGPRGPGMGPGGPGAPGCFQQQPGCFDPPQRYGPPMRPLGPPQPHQQGFMHGQRFQEPHNPQFPGGPLGPHGVPPPFPGPQGGSFNMQGPPPFSQPAAGPFYNPSAPPAGSMQQQVTVMSSHNQPFLPHPPVPFCQPGPVFSGPESHFGQVDVNDLLSKLISTGIIPAAQPAQPDAPPTAAEASVDLPVAPTVVEEEDEEDEEEEESLPDLTGFQMEDLRPRYEGVVARLHTGIQCYSCGMRFTSSQTDVYADHLDWHYRHNRSEKDLSRRITHRRWYYGLTDWVEFEEIADLEERSKSHFFEKVHEEVVQRSQEAAKQQEVQSVKATADVVGESCEICQEAFEMFWEEDEEEWHLKNALRMDNKTYHPSCYDDYINTSLTESTPSPNKLLTEHPLSVFVKQEPSDEVTSCLSQAPQEVKVEAEEPCAVKEEVPPSAPP